ncbi:uncharacterized protein [Nicotiana tomentosiformis]|uniref:uncharacterized protein n=1 Tax=Nicotiana tomentosiformis TaxID=4098 RepID=UPI00388CB204
MHALPFPQKHYKEKLDKQFEMFLDMLRQVNVNLPFTEVLSQMPAYAKFLKEILTKKRKFEETSVVKLAEHCSAILQIMLPQKCGDPGSFTIPCSLGSIKFDKSLYDSGASINLMPLFIYKKSEINIEENKEVPLILGRPFLVTGRAILDIYDRKLMLRVGEKTVTFEMNVETGLKKEKPAASVEWIVKSSKEKSTTSGKYKCGV